MDDLQEKPEKPKNIKFFWLESPEEMICRPLYQDDTKAKPADILAYYEFSELVRCGLNNCHQKNKKGYYIQTDDGKETNIGRDCGKTHFGVEYELMRIAFDHEYTAHIQKKRIDEFNAQAAAIFGELRNLTEQECGIKWLRKSILEFSRFCGKDFVGIIRLRALRSELEVTEPRRLTKQEFEDRQAANPGVPEEHLSHFTDESKGQLQGTKIFTKPLYDWADNWGGKLLEQSSGDIDKLSSAKLGKLSKAIDEFKIGLVELEGLTQEGRKFFQEENLRLLPYLTTNKALQKKLAKLKWDFHKSEAVEMPVESETTIKQYSPKEKAWLKMMGRKFDS